MVAGSPALEANDLSPKSCRIFATGAECIFDRGGTFVQSQTLDLNPKVTNIGSGTLCGMAVRSAGAIESLSLLFFNRVVNLTVSVSNFDHQGLGKPAPTYIAETPVDNCGHSNASSFKLVGSLSKVQTCVSVGHFLPCYGPSMWWWGGRGGTAAGGGGGGGGTYI